MSRLIINNDLLMNINQSFLLTEKIENLSLLFAG